MSSTSSTTDNKIAQIFDANSCFFCEEKAISKSYLKLTLDRRRRKCVKTVRHNIQTKILETARHRKDIVAKQVLQRIQNVDLVAIEAKYHERCSRKFLEEKRQKNAVRLKRNIDMKTKIEETVSIFKRYPEELFTIPSLMKAVNFTEDPRTLRNRLKENGNIFIGSGAGSELILTNTDHADRILLKMWKKSKEDEVVQEERAQIVCNAASIILEDVKATVHEDSIPPLEMFLESDIPPTLKMFLTRLMKSNHQNSLSAAHTIFTVIHKMVNSRFDPMKCEKIKNDVKKNY